MKTMILQRRVWPLFLIIAILLAVIVWQNWPRPPVATGPSAVESPSKEERRQADLVMTEKRTGELIGHQPLPTGQLNPWTYPAASPIPAASRGPSDPWATPGPVPEPTALSWTIPVSGEMTTRYIDARTGLEIGQGTHPFSGETKVWFDAGEIWAKTTFTDTIDIAINVPRPPPKLWHFGAYSWTEFKDLWCGVYVQKDWLLYEGRSVDLLGWGRLDFVGRPLREDHDWKLRPGAGIEIRF